MSDASDVLDGMTDRQDKLVAVFIAVLAVMLAICETGGNNAEKEAVKANIDASNAYAFFQAKNIRQTSLRLSAMELRLRLKETPPPGPELERELKAQIDALEKKADRYQSEPETGDGKKELLEKARRLEVERDDLLARDPYFDIASALIQIAIVLASVAIVIDSRPAFIISATTGVTAVVLMLNGFFMFMRLPFFA